MSENEGRRGRREPSGNGLRTPQLGDRVIYWLPHGDRLLKPLMADLIGRVVVAGEFRGWIANYCVPETGMYRRCYNIRLSETPAPRCVTFALPPGNPGDPIPYEAAEPSKEAALAVA